MALPSNAEMQSILDRWSLDPLIQPYIPQGDLGLQSKFFQTTVNVQERMKALKIKMPPAEMNLDLRTLVMLICSEEARRVKPGDEVGLAAMKEKLALAKQSGHLYGVQEKV